jgi:ABC-type lipoprotein release transport system permease subunit
MSWTRLLFRNLFYHWAGNLAVLLGVAVGAAVLTGALLVGDSLRGSLRERALRQLGWVDRALVSNRFIREALANELTAVHVSPVILMQGTVSQVQKGWPTVRATRVTILGVDDRFWSAGGAGAPACWSADREGVFINEALARQMNVTVGAPLTVAFPKTAQVPRESLLGRRDFADVLEKVEVPLAGIVAESPMANFTLAPSPEAPRNAFVPLALLQARLRQPGRVNALLAAGGADLEGDLQRHLTLDDWGLAVHDPSSRARALFAKLDRNNDRRLTRNEYNRRVPDAVVRAADRDRDEVLTYAEVADYYRAAHPYIALDSRQMLLSPSVAEAARAAALETHLRAAPTLVYLANTISDGAHSIPYSVVAALDPAQPAPLGPSLPSGHDHLKNDEIILVDWKQSPLAAAPGSSIELTYFRPEQEGRLDEVKATFRLAGRIPLAGPALDPELTPSFPGITDKLGIRDWDPPFPYYPSRVQRRDETYWDEYHATPKAYVTLAAGQKLWGSRFGELTSIRLAAEPGRDLGQAADEFRRALLGRLRPEQGGLVFDPARQRALEASAGSTPFDWLFLGFSFFLIAAALLLIGLLFRLNLDRRGPEIGLLLATGQRRGRVRRLLLAEGAILTAVGAALGLSAAVLYTWLLLGLLRAWWPGGLGESFLQLHVGESYGLSFLIGYVASAVMSVLTILWAVRVLSRVAPAALLAGGATDTSTGADAGRPPRWSVRIAVVSALGAAILLVSGWFVRDQEMRASSFFGGGALLLTAGLSGVWAWMHGARQRRVNGHGARALALLGVRNAARYPLRSLLTVGLLASAVFLVVAVESFHRPPDMDPTDPNSGTGGFALVAESDVPVYQDLNTPEGREEAGIPASVPWPSQARVYSLRLQAGDDTSCLNLYQPRRPRVLGVPHALVERGGFRFAESEARTTQDRADPWRLLEGPAHDGVPAIADAATVTWILKTRLGESVEVPDGFGRPRRLRIVGVLADSVLQSQLLISEANFLALYPDQEGYRFFLIDIPPHSTGKIADYGEACLGDRGFEVAWTDQRLQSYLAVENTYLLTFQALGGLGLLLGALGLAVVLLRTVWERRGELALLRALGFRRAALGWLVFSENSFLLVLGLAVGIVAALLAVAPYLLSGAGEVPWLRLAGLVGLVLAVGLTAAAAAVAGSLRAPLLQALHRE